MGPRHSLTEDTQAIDFFFHLVIEPVFLLGGFAGNQYSKQRQEQLQRLDTRGFPTNADEI